MGVRVWRCKCVDGCQLPVPWVNCTLAAGGVQGAFSRLPQTTHLPATLPTSEPWSSGFPPATAREMLRSKFQHWTSAVLPTQRFGLSGYPLPLLDHQFSPATGFFLPIFNNIFPASALPPVGLHFFAPCHRKELPERVVLTCCPHFFISHSFVHNEKSCIFL